MRLCLQMGRCFTHSFIIMLIICYVRTIWYSRELSESVLNMLINTSGGSSAISLESLGMSLLKSQKCTAD